MAAETQPAFDFAPPVARDYAPYEPVVVAWPGGPVWPHCTVHWAGDVQGLDCHGRPETWYVVAVNVPDRRYPWPVKPEWVRREADSANPR